MAEELVGRVFNFFAKIMVAGVGITGGSLKVGDTIRVLGATTDFETQVASMQEGNQAITEAHAGQQVGIKLPQRARENDEIYKIIE